ELLGDGRRAARPPPRPPRREHGPRERADVDAPVLEEALVLDRDDGIDEVRRDVVELHPAAIFASRSMLPERRAVTVGEGDRVVRAHEARALHVGRRPRHRERERRAGRADGEHPPRENDETPDAHGSTHLPHVSILWSLPSLRGSRRALPPAASREREGETSLDPSADRAWRSLPRSRRGSGWGVSRLTASRTHSRSTTTRRST